MAERDDEREERDNLELDEQDQAELDAVAAKMAEQDDLDDYDQVEEQLSLADEDERLPWLESDDDYDDQSVDLSRLIGVILVGLLVVLGILGLAWWLSQPKADAELQPEGTTIEAPDEAFRTRPEDAGGSEVAGTGDTSFEVGEGQSRDSQLAGAANAPGFDRSQGQAGQGQTNSAAQGASGTESGAASASSGNFAIQVAAYSSRERAEQGWNDLSGRYSALGGLGHRIQEATVDGAKVYRLQAMTSTREAANSACNAVRAAGGDCQVVR